MEKNKHIDELDAFAKKYVKEIKIEKAPADFTSSIINTIAEEKRNAVFKTSTLISKKGWFLIAASLISVVFIPFTNSKENTLSFLKIDFSFLEKFQNVNMFEGITISNTVYYSVFFFGFMLLFQLVFLKKYFEKRTN
ncbi:hypothetical protein [Polaribacter cellanae]|uniref:Uncharacterized protein n=1 Tax=Polaribacter cellanae TaxID=2818493 RepID=A0A975H7S8_9FLAO|nr:hypothetical protein [Polaribacter cellanae]QTE23836.1 hypothetical protein J3359_06095 [Polaribacter cellanae]